MAPHESAGPETGKNVREPEVPDLLDELRSGIDDVDDELLELLARRQDLTRRVVETKRRQGLPLRNREREAELLRRIADGAAGRSLDPHFVTNVFHQVIEGSLRSQRLTLQSEAAGADRERPVRVVFQGVEGAYSHEACERFFAGSDRPRRLSGRRTFADVAAAVEGGEADYGLLPIENTTAGSLNQVYDLLIHGRLAVVGEQILEIEHCLLVPAGGELGRIRRVLSHWQALAQCSRFLAGLPHCEAESFEDTALAVRKVAEDGDPAQAAIASEAAARRYGLAILERGIADELSNFTRFVVVAAEPLTLEPAVECKTSLVMATGHRPGALYEALEVLQRHGLNLTKLESRPRRGSPFEYLFLLDLEGNTADPRVAEALDELRGATRYLRVLGSYPAQLRGRTRPQPRPVTGSPGEPKKAEKKGPSDGPPRPAGGSPALPPTSRSYRLASRRPDGRRTVIRVGEVEIGGPELVIIAGPCAVETEEQIFACARQVREAGGRMLRGGCFKPRTSPYSFQGLGFEGLELLAAAGREYGLPVVTEVLSPEDAARIAEHADVLQIGARNMQNFRLLTEVGRLDTPVLLKRGLSASIEELLSAAEYILSHGNQQVILCERGIRTFETYTRNTLDLGAVPLLAELSHLPIVVDPSHAAGRRELVPPLARAACGVGPHGLMVEIHPRPEEALSDGPQALTFEDFAALVASLQKAV